MVKGGGTHNRVGGQNFVTRIAAGSRWGPGKGYPSIGLKIEKSYNEQQLLTCCLSCKQLSLSIPIIHCTHTWFAQELIYNRYIINQ